LAINSSSKNSLCCSLSSFACMSNGYRSKKDTHNASGPCRFTHPPCFSTGYIHTEY
jgi:hypothetical protein